MAMAMAAAPFNPKAMVDSAWKIIPFFQSRDIHETVLLYTNELGFTLGSEEPHFASLFAGPKAASNIYFSLCREGSEFRASSAMIALGAEQHEALYAGLLARKKQCQDEGLPESKMFRIVEEIRDEEWGFRQFSIKDRDGNQLTFFRFLEGSNGEELWGGEGVDD
ncbi:uncharacterized protein DFL_000949 [Arthrobotrys flagrans]|uniref:Glyoxalase/fosfomycin resistance/dioxygenase domain-containing protein n=1 Tax=Arthrobotrys flagrans TaxID=97331 RepID=A0A437AFR5_ARTFL|nr:hypothetical protein DFL_000949 [Arthrobotrys flagrans]